MEGRTQLTSEVDELRGGTELSRTVAEGTVDVRKR